MKKILKVVFLLLILFIVVGFVLESNANPNGKLFIGIGVSIFAFVLMPLFIYHRYNGRINDFVDKRMEKPIDDESKSPQ